MTESSIKTLFDQPPLARNTDPITSHIAADKIIESGELSAQEEMVYDILKKYNNPNGFTVKEPSHYRSDSFYFMLQRRLSGLARKGCIEFLTTDGRWVKILDENNRPATRDGCRIIRAV
jgi:hypothetical protein